MTGENALIYSEEQKFRLWLRWLIAASMALAVLLSIFSLTKIPSEQGSADILPILTVIIAGICVPIAVAWLFLVLKLETEVRPDGLYIRFFPFHIHFKRFGSEDLSGQRLFRSVVSRCTSESPFVNIPFLP